MKQLLTANSMRLYETQIFDAGNSPIDVMEQAAQGICDFVTARFEKTANVCIVCGKGNNGGDGIAAARLLFYDGYNVQIILAMGQPQTENAKINLEKATKLGIPVVVEDYSGLDYCDIVVDAVLGIGVSGAVELDCIEKINNCHAFKLAVDIPTGVNADTGEVVKTAVKADATVTFGYIKTGIVQYPGKTFAGEIFVAKIGEQKPNSFDAFLPDDLHIKNLIPRKSDDANKGNFGRLLVIAGSVGMTGAAHLACMGALRSGCGLVTLAIPENLNPIMEIKLTEAMTLPLKCHDRITYASMSNILEGISRYNAVVIGPGLGVSDEVTAIIDAVLESGVPTVIDADGINSIAANINILRNSRSPVILTPHPGEFARLTGKEICEIQQNRLSLARDFAKETGVTLVLKGAATVVTSAYGSVMINPTGNRGMATGGSGDVLAGVAGAFAAQGMSTETAAQAAVYVHGAAGDIAAHKYGKQSLIASDIVNNLSSAFMRIVGG